MANIVFIDMGGGRKRIASGVGAWLIPEIPVSFLFSPVFGGLHRQMPGDCRHLRKRGSMSKLFHVGHPVLIECIQARLPMPDIVEVIWDVLFVGVNESFDDR